MFAQGGVDERQQVFVRGRELFNERRRRLSMGADDDEDYNESNNEDCVFPVEELLRAPTAEEVASDGEDDGLEADGASLEPPIAAARVGATAAATEVEQVDCEVHQALDGLLAVDGAQLLDEGPTGASDAASEVGPVSHADRALEAALAAAAAASRNRTSRGVVEWDLPELPPEPREVAARRKPAAKTMKILRWIKRLWELWLLRKQAEMAESGPTWEQAHEFIRFLSAMRQKRCLADSARRGLGETTLVNVVGFLVSAVCSQVPRAASLRS